MILDTIEAWQLDMGDFVVIDSEECVVTDIDDEGALVRVFYRDEFGDPQYVDVDPYTVLEIWGN